MKYWLIRYFYSTYFPKIYNRTNVFGIRNKTVFDYNYQLWRNEKIKPNIAVEEKKVDAPAKNPATYEKRVSINEFEQKPLDEYQIQRVILSKPKAVSTKEMMDAKAAEKRKERNEKRALLENQLAQNIKETNNLESSNKKRKVSL